MWNARSKLKTIKSRTLRCAVQLEFMTVRAAREVDTAVAKLNGSTLTLDWLIEQGHLTEDEAAEIYKAREREFPDDHNAEEHKRLRRAIHRSDKELTRLESVLRAMNGS